MGRYILGRLGGLLIAFVLVSMITFLLMHAVPGGPFDETKQPLPEAAKANILRKYGLDKPIWEQYLRYMWNAVHLDFGIPFQSPTETVTGLIARVWLPTLQLAGVVILLSYSLGLILGIIAAIYQNTWIDHFVTVLATLGFAVPSFVVAIWMILIFAVSLHWLPTGGWGAPENYIMPVFVYSLAPTAMVARLYSGQYPGSAARRLCAHSAGEGVEAQHDYLPACAKKCPDPHDHRAGPQDPGYCHRVDLHRSDVPHSRVGAILRDQHLEPGLSNDHGDHAAGSFPLGNYLHRYRYSLHVHRPALSA